MSAIRWRANLQISSPPFFSSGVFLLIFIMMPKIRWHIISIMFFITIFSLPHCFDLPSFVVDTPLQRLKRKLLTKSEDKDQKKRKGRGKKRAILFYKFFFTYQTFMMYVHGGKGFEVVLSVLLFALFINARANYMYLQMSCGFTITTLVNINNQKKELRMNRIKTEIAWLYEFYVS